MTYHAEILADSVSPDGVRLTTLWVTFPRFILAEVNTHRMLSRNSNSSRAIPPERQIEAVRKEPFIPDFNSRVKGMGVGNPLDDDDHRIARSAWLDARDNAVRNATCLLDLNVDKSRINRLLEPFLWHSAIISATEWDNFFALRDHPAAQPEFQILARMMHEAMESSYPCALRYGEWHTPGVDERELDEEGINPEEHWDTLKRVSAGRLARWTSYAKTDPDPPEVAYERAGKLIDSFHLSPTEHQARPATYSDVFHRQLSGPAPDTFFGNFRGWVQFRKQIPNEHNAALARNLT